MRFFLCMMPLAALLFLSCNSVEPPDDSDWDNGVSETGQISDNGDASISSSLFGASSSSFDTGTEDLKTGLAAIRALFAVRDFETLVHTRYVEASKTENETDIQDLIDTYEAEFETDAALAEILDLYDRLLESDPSMENEGKTARFFMPEGFIRFSVMEDGRWGFYL